MLPTPLIITCGKILVRGTEVMVVKIKIQTSFFSEVLETKS